ncbi:MAG: hypothetical protein ACI8ZM_005600 [Crocinitomix sp.]|jgi:hypothetical protein
MKNLLLLSLLFVTAVFCSFGQKLSEHFTVTGGDSYPVVNGENKKYISTNDGFITSIKTDGALVTVQRYDVNGMKEVGRNSYEDFPKYSKVQRIIETTNGLYYIFEAYNKKDETFSVYSRKINTDEASFESSKKLFTTTRPAIGQSMDTEGKTSMVSKGAIVFNKGVKFQVLQSFDKSKVLIVYRVKPIEKSDAKNYDILGFYVFDPELSQISGDEVKMPHTEKEMNNLAYTVDSEGTAYMMAFLREAKKFELLKISPDGNLEQFPLAINGDLVFQKFNLTEDSNGNIVCSGFYANGYDFKVNWTGNAALSFNTNGVYCFKMGKDGSVFDVYDIEFPVKIIEQYLSEREQKKLKAREEKGKAGIADLIMVEFFQQKDGSCIIVGEQQYAREEMVMASTQLVYHYGSVIVTKINVDGSVAWMKKLPKNQHGVCTYSWNAAYFEGQMGVKYVNGADAHYLLFIDNPKNADLSLNSTPAGHKNGMGGFISAFKIDDADGSIERHTIADMHDLDGSKAYQFKVTRICKAMDNTFMMEVYLKGKKDGMIKLELNK